MSGEKINVKFKRAVPLTRNSEGYYFHSVNGPIMAALKSVDRPLTTSFKKTNINSLPKVNFTPNIKYVTNSHITVGYVTRKPNPEFNKYLCSLFPECEIIEKIGTPQMPITLCYNRIIEEAQNDIILLIHDDISFEEIGKYKGSIPNLITQHFKESDYGILGIAGGTEIKASKMQWTNGVRYLHIIQGYKRKEKKDVKAILPRYSTPYTNTINRVLTIDGVFIALHRKRIKAKFDEANKSFHHYDIDFSLSNHLQGVKIGCIKSVLIRHASEGDSTGEEYTKVLKDYMLPKWEKYMPMRLNEPVKEHKKVKIGIVHYNTPTLTKALIHSINKYTPNATIYIFDNSDKSPLLYRQDNIVYFDNTKGKIIDFQAFLKKYENQLSAICKRSNYGSAKHSYSIEKLMELIGDNFILLDSDTLLKKDISGLNDDRYIYVGETGEAVKTRHTRVFPFCCYINVKQCKENGIHYFNDKYMAGIDGRGDNDFYDTGAYFYASCKGKNIKIIKHTDYVVHMASASWQNKQNNEENFLKKYQNLWDSPKERLIVTMTSWTKRIGNLPVVLGTILDGNKKPDLININLAVEEFPNKEKDIPSNVLDFIKNNQIEINWVEENIRQWKKTIPTMFKYPNDCIVCIDDDRKYPKEFLSTLWAEHLKYPNNPITVNAGYRYKGKYLQHAGHGTLDKLEYYNGFKNVLSPELYKLASSDTFFTLIAHNAGHPIRFVGKRIPILMYNEKNPLNKSEGTYGTKTHDIMYNYLKNKKMIPNIK